jgi:excisionase family DNA binding protein
MFMEPTEASESAPPSTRSVFVGVAAQLLGVSVRTVYYRIHQGRLRTVRTRCGSQRVLLESVEALLREELRKRSRRRAER